MAQMANVSPEQMKKGMEPWMFWAQKCGNQLVDLGQPLANAHRMSKTEHGPVDSNVAGYSILQGNSMDEIKPLIENHPHLNWVEGAQIEVFEMQSIPGME